MKPKQKYAPDRRWSPGLNYSWQVWQIGPKLVVSRMLGFTQHLTHWFRLLSYTLAGNRPCIVLVMGLTASKKTIPVRGFKSETCSFWFCSGSARDTCPTNSRWFFHFVRRDDTLTRVHGRCVHKVKENYIEKFSRRLFYR